MKSIWNTALNILARREHSRGELYSKLSARFPESPEEIESVLDRLAKQGLQSDDRFAEAWFRYQLSKSRGPSRIKAEAKAKGVTTLIQPLIDHPDQDWFERALQCAQRKIAKIQSMEEKAKIYRFLAYRGYEPDAIKYAIDELSIK